MFIPSDPRLVIPGMSSLQRHDKFHSPLYHGHLSGVAAVCDSDLLGRKGWYLAQAVAFAQTQMGMAEEQWMSSSESMEVSFLFFFSSFVFPPVRCFCYSGLLWLARGALSTRM
jgi:hypothetical protein